MSTTTNALAQLIGHCKERHPHFESPRGQLDIANAQAERQALIDALKLCAAEIQQFHAAYHPECDADCPAHEAMKAARLALGVNGVEL